MNTINATGGDVKVAKADTCKDCATDGMHYLSECVGTCPKTGQLHRDMPAEQFTATTMNCYWSARCTLCGKRWEVDSSG